MTTSNDAAIDSKIKDQTIHCSKSFLSQKDYFKRNFQAVIWVVMIIVVIFSGVVAWSYEPIKDIATLKSKYTTIEEKLDLLIKLANKE